jgi:Protein of unknown function (DUF1097)
MSAKLKATVPLALSVGVIAFVYVEFAANFTFHWVTSGNLGNGLDLPSNFHIVIPAAFVSWGMFFALGADNSALRSTALNCLVGSVSGLILFVFVDIVKGVPDFWAISLGVGLLAFILVMASGGFAWINVPVIFTAFGCCVFWWIATGLDGWAPNGGGVGNSVAALSKPATAGTGAFGGVLSTPFTFVALDVFVTLLIGCLCGTLSARLAGVLTPKPRSAPRTSPPRGTAAA